MGFRATRGRRFHAHRKDDGAPVQSFGVAFRAFDADSTPRFGASGFRIRMPAAPRFGFVPRFRVRSRLRLGPRLRVGLPASVLFAAGGAVVIAFQPVPLASTAGGPPATRDGDRGALTAGAGAGSETLTTREPDPFGARSGLDTRFAAPPDSLTGYRWPLTNARVTQVFGPASRGSFLVNGEGFHDGIDLASFCGDHVVAAHDGVVIAAGRHTVDKIGWVGNVAAYKARLDANQAWSGLAVGVVIDDGNGYRSIYVHFRRAVVTVGQHVKAGDFIGTEGATGNARGCHLHYGLYSPAAAGRFLTDPDIVRRTLAPAAVIARIDPLLVLPPLKVGHNTWGWGARETD